jgi:hypothetical protein
MTSFHARAAACGLALAILPSISAGAHGVVGDRFFPATLATDDPFTADELALPTITSFNHETDYDFEYSKTIVPGVAVAIEGGYIDATGASGWDNIALTPLVEVFRDEDHETILTAGFIWEIGGSGSKSVADRASSYTPELLFGKGFGDLPDSMALLRPFAFTGQLGFKIPGTSDDSKAVEWGGALEYSLHYLQSNVHDQGFSPFIARVTPIVEFSLETPTERSGGETTGTINPGLIWSGQYIQVGAEAIIPVNRASGRSVGVIAQLHFFVDDIFAHSLGSPVLGGLR